jgi:hypothetical protein
VDDTGKLRWVWSDIGSDMALAMLFGLLANAATAQSIQGTATYRECIALPRLRCKKETHMSKNTSNANNTNRRPGCQCGETCNCGGGCTCGTV